MEDRDSLTEATVADAEDGDDAPALPTFDRPAEPFALGAELGRGGMGRVIAAVDRALDRPVAIKQALSQRPDDLRRFEREARITARLEHPAIVPVHETGRDGDGNPFYVMRRIAGEPLADRITAARSTRELLALVPNVLAAVDAAAFAHARGVIHRDIKPTNILVGAYGETLLIDWGLARELADRDKARVLPRRLVGSAAGGGDAGAPLTHAGDMFGTPGYMAPEQVRDAGAVDARADVHALGATLFHVVAGERPFTGTAAQYVAAVATGWRPDLARIAPDVPRELITIVAKATATEPGERYRDAGELAADLRAFLAGNLVAAHRYTTLERLARFVRRHRAAVAIATLAAIALAGGATLAVLRVVGAEHAARHRADQLLVEHARGLLADDPVRAVALLRFADRLDPGERWAIGVEAVWRGLPQVWRAHDSTVRGLALLDDGGVVTAGMREPHVVLRRPGGSRREIGHYDGPIMQIIALPRGFAVATPTTVERFDLAGAPVATWPAHDSTRLAAGAGLLAQRDTTGITARELASGRELWHVAADRNADFAFDAAGRWLAIGDVNGGRVVEVATGSVRELVPATTVVWSPRGDRLLLAQSNGPIASWTTGDWASPPVMRTPPWLGVGFVAGVAVYVDRASHCVMTLDQGNIYACMAGLRSWDSALGAIGFDGTALLVHDSWSVLRLGSVPNRPNRVLDDPQRRWLVAGGSDDGRVAIWDLAARGSPTRSLDIGFAYFKDDDVIADVRGTISQIPRTGAPVPLVELGTPNPLRVSVPVGDAFAVLDAGGALYVARKDQRDLIAQRDIEGIVARNDHELIARRADGVIALFDLRARGGRELVTRKAPPNELRVDDGRAVVSWSDGHVFWLDPDDSEHAADVGCPVQMARWQRDGLEVACANHLYAWRGERLHLLAELPTGAELYDWAAGEAGYTLATRDGAVYRADGRGVTQLNPAGAGGIALGGDRFASCETGSGRIFIHDVRSGARAQIGQVDMPARLALSADGRAVIAIIPNRMLRWDDPSPRDPAAWPAWVARLTPATLREPNAELEWP